MKDIKIIKEILRRMINGLLMNENWLYHNNWLDLKSNLYIKTLLLEVNE